MHTTGRVGIDVEVGAFICAHGSGEHIEAHRLVFCEGDQSRSVYACVRGRVKVFVTTPSGREVVIGYKGRGEAFGELSAIDGRPRAVSARTIETSVVAHMSGVCWADHLAREPHLSNVVLRSLAGQLRRANDRLCERTTDSAFIRTGHLLIELASLQQLDGRSQSPVELMITQYDIAEWIGTVRESVARALSELRKAGAVETGRGRIVVNDIDELTEIVRAAERPTIQSSPTIRDPAPSL